MTPQEIFDHVCSNLIAQGKPSVNSKRKCMYRGDGGFKCAVGWLIPDEGYTPDLELKSVWFEQVQDALGWRDGATLIVSDVERDLVWRLQQAHDHAATGVICLSEEEAKAGKPWRYRTDAEWLGEFKRRAGNLADKMGLDKAVLT